IENLQRADLNPVEEAKAFVRLAKEFDLRQEDIAKRVGKNRATVANSMRLLDLGEEVLLHVGQGRLSVGHAKVLLQEKSEEQQRLLADQVIKRGLSVRETEKLLSGIGIANEQGKSQRKAKAEPELAAAIEAVTETLRERFGTKVVVQHGKKRGKIEIEYYGNEDLERVMGLMGVKVGEDL
ncbi:MAG: ParB/RepB/Spo0J family partition protein, partial [Verrucomicrobiales bacterium]|nr:ParB/RepB/Spo0J family partition protein [Verrucomicrobiales bacterium]